VLLEEVKDLHLLKQQLFVFCDHCHSQSCLNITPNYDSADTFYNINIQEAK